LGPQQAAGRIEVRQPGEAVVRNDQRIADQNAMGQTAELTGALTGTTDRPEQCAGSAENSHCVVARLRDNHFTRVTEENLTNVGQRLLRIIDAADPERLLDHPHIEVVPLGRSGGIRATARGENHGNDTDRE
jgi:hypothetical protein